MLLSLFVTAAILVACGADDSGTTAPATTAAASVETSATQTSTAADASFPPGTQHLHFEFGPVDVQPGQNSIDFSKGQIPKPDADGWILRISANLRREDGSVPPVDVIHLHHGVWLNASRPDSTFPSFPERFFAAGEEKTTTEFPPGYGYEFHTKDRWVLNYMLHNLTSDPEKLWLTYDLDFLPASEPAAASIVGARPVWLDVQNGSGYPVFDVIKGTGTDGTFTYPDQATDPYDGGPAKNVWTVDTDGVLVGTGGHLHPGGLHDDLWLDRTGQTAAPLPIGRQVLRTGGRGVVGRRDDRHEPRLARCRSQGRHPPHLDHLRLGPRLLVRVDGDHGRVDGRSCRRRHRSVRDAGR